MRIVNLAIDTSVALSVLFFVLLVVILMPNVGIFFKRHGIRHRLIGLIYLIWLLLGLGDALLTLFRDQVCVLYYDIVFGILGILLTISAAFDFQHKGIKNVASGTLDAHSTVTYDEMMEHSFYQGLNLLQIVYIHIVCFTVSGNHHDHITWAVTQMDAIGAVTAAGPYLTPMQDNWGRIEYIWRPAVRVLRSSYHSTPGLAHLLPGLVSPTPTPTPDSYYTAPGALLFRVCVCYLLTVAPWLARSWFPVHPFSQNWTVTDPRSSPLVRLLYRIKKYQYVFYKHFLLFGLNLTLACAPLNVMRRGSSSADAEGVGVGVVEC